VELSWSTLLLEVINFLILIWILKRFLYRPVLAMIEQRRQHIETQTEAARATQQQADSLKAQYEQRLTDWDKEKRQANESLQKELQQERTKRLQQLQQDMDSQREENRHANQQQLAEQDRQYRAEALKLGADFASKLLSAVACVEVHNQLVELSLTQLASLVDSQIQTLRNALVPTPDQIKILTAYALEEDQQQRLTKALQEFCSSPIPVNFIPEPDLIAGLEIELGSSLLRLNIRDQLQDFARLRTDETGQ